MSLSTHAAAAKAIRVELKKHSIKARVTCSCYSMGNEVSVYVDNLPPWVMKEIKSFADQFEYGHFDPSQDLYVYSSRRDDIPQVKFVSVSNDFSDDMHQKAYAFLLNRMVAYEGFPLNYEDAKNNKGSSSWVSEEVYQVLSGYRDEMISHGCSKFWNKPRIKCAA